MPSSVRPATRIKASLTARETPATRRIPGWFAVDERLFNLLGGGHAAHPVVVRLACVVARWSWLPLLALMVAAVWPLGLAGARLLAVCLGTATVAQLISKRLARHWQVQRPFMRGLSPNHLGHSTRGGFPSTHAMVMGAVLGFMLLVLPAGHPLLPAMALTVVATGWARVCAGAHFLLDVLAGSALGLVCGAIGAHLFVG
jgi:undecaprenyl-diphosphatase